MTSKSDLRRAVEPVKAYLHGERLTANAVLAAWMRHEGVPASGEDWLVAKAALEAGQGFREAAQTAAALGHRQRGRAAAAPRVRASSPAPRRAIVEPPKTARKVAGLPVMEQLAKPRSAGDMNAEGARRLLGAFSLDPVSVLVRETAQNSWDARLRRHEPGVELVYHLFQATEEQTQLLREHVFSGTLGLDGLRASLKGRPWLLEISDRGTKGLGGPTRNDQPVAAGEPTDYMDLVLNLGAPRDVAKGGGTYGFGKTITYTMSTAETVLIWTSTGATREHRLIGSAMGSYFDHEQRAFTGRHWWGLAYPQEDRIEPLIGPEAEALAAPLFSRGFAEDETGTSMLIVAPDFGERTASEFVDALARSIELELWPKLVPHSAVHPMTIRVRMNGAEVPLTTPAEHPILRHYARCLKLIRDNDSGIPARRPLDTKFVEIRAGRHSKLIGHLALARLPGVPPHRPEEETPLRRVCLMRHEAELVVKYHRSPGTVDGGEDSWVAVFKPLGDIDIDNEFALSEPPTHDDWIPPRKAGQSRVRMAFTKIKAELDATFKPRLDLAEPPVGSGAPVGPLAHELAGLVPVGVTQQPLPRSSPASRAKGRPRVVVISSDFADAPPGMVAWDLMVEVKGETRSPITVTATPHIVTDGGGAPRGEGETDPSLAKVIQWFNTEGQVISSHSTAVLDPSRQHVVRVSARADLAVSVRFRMAP